jgi:hypothetical protein
VRNIKKPEPDRVRKREKKRERESTDVLNALFLCLVYSIMVSNTFLMRINRLKNNLVLEVKMKKHGISRTKIARGHKRDVPNQANLQVLQRNREGMKVTGIGTGTTERTRVVIIREIIKEDGEIQTTSLIREVIKEAKISIGETKTSIGGRIEIEVEIKRKWTKIEIETGLEISPENLT